MKNDLERHRERQSKRQTVTQKLSRKNPETAIKRIDRDWEDQHQKAKP